MDCTHNHETGLYEVEIDGHIYEFSKWGAGEATSTLLDIMTIIGKPLGAVAAGWGQPGGEGMTSEKVAQAIDHAASQIGAHKTLCMDLIKKFATRCHRDHKPIKNFDTAYQDRIPHLFNVLHAAIEVQYGAFFAGALDATGLGRPRASSPAPSRPS